MKKASIIMAVLACAIIAVAYTNSVPISANTRAATEKWTAIRFEPALPPTPENAEAKFLTGNREWQTVAAEQDLAALRTYHYGSPDIVESPAEWFVLDGAGTITAFHWEEGRENVVIPWAIGGVPVTAIGANAFYLKGIVSVIAPQTVTEIYNYAFPECPALTSVTIPQVTTIGDGAFVVCPALTTVHMGQNAPAEATSIGVGAFAECSALTS
ncbi:MAG: leucine-rich repeat domain-containing protein, partial [Candidatus Paceibacterota bacterium]